MSRDAAGRWRRSGRELGGWHNCRERGFAADRSRRGSPPWGRSFTAVAGGTAALRWLCFYGNELAVPALYAGGSAGNTMSGHPCGATVTEDVDERGRRGCCHPRSLACRSLRCDGVDSPVPARPRPVQVAMPAQQASQTAGSNLSPPTRTSVCSAGCCILGSPANPITAATPAWIARDALDHRHV